MWAGVGLPAFLLFENSHALMMPVAPVHLEIANSLGHEVLAKAPATTAISATAAAV